MLNPIDFVNLITKNSSRGQSEGRRAKRKARSAEGKAKRIEQSAKSNPGSFRGISIRSGG